MLSKNQAEWSERAYEIACNRVASARRRQILHLVLTERRNLRRLPKLDQLPSVKSLRIDQTKVVDIGAISDLTLLNELNANFTRVSDISALSTMAHMEKLLLRDAPVRDVSHLRLLTQLKELDLSGTLVASIEALSGLNKLLYLNLYRTNISEIFALRGLGKLQVLNVSRTKLVDISPLENLTSLQGLDISQTDVQSIEPVRRLIGLKDLNISNTKVSDLGPTQELRQLEYLSANRTRIADIRFVSHLTKLRRLDIANTGVSDISSLSGLPNLELLKITRTYVSDLAPLALATSLVDAVKRSRFDGGLDFEDCPLSDINLVKISKLKNPERTIQAINYLREKQGLPPYLGKKEEDKLPPLPIDAPDAIEGVPSPFDFQVTERGTIAVAGSDTNIPAFPFATSREDHARRLETCKVSTGDLIEALSAQRYHNVRQEYLAYLTRYQERLPQSAENGNMLLADGVARSLSKLFSAEATILPDAFAAELHTLLEQHIVTCAYYPEIGTFNRDVRDGKPSRPFPLMAAEALILAVQAHTPGAFEPSVSRALCEVQISPPLPPAVSSDLPLPSPQTILPPPIPGGETDPRKSQEFAKASTTNRLWKVVKATATVSGASHGVIDAAKALAPHVKEMIDWLNDVIASL